MNYSDTKLGQIERKIGTGGFNIVIGYIMEKGFEFCRSLTDEDIETAPDMQFMTKSLFQQTLKTSREICSECCVFDEFIPYIRTQMTLGSAPTNEIFLDKSEISNYGWEWILSDLNIDNSKAKRLKLIVVDIVEEE